VLVVSVEMATGTDTGPVGQLVALVGGMGLAVLVARLVLRGSVPASWPSRPIDPKEWLIFVVILILRSVF
jgi:hypothetical protein